MSNSRTAPITLAALALAGVALSTSLQAQTPASAPTPTSTKPASQQIENPNCPEIVGHHALLEKMTEAFGLTCKQEDIIEPLLHDEESVTKPLLAFQAFTP